MFRFTTSSMKPTMSWAFRFRCQTMYPMDRRISTNSPRISIPTRKAESPSPRTAPNRRRKETQATSTEKPLLTMA